MAILWPGKLRKGSEAAERCGRAQQCVPWLRACETLTFSCGALQTTAHPPQENHLSAATSDPLWRAVRKGTAPAFSPQNMRCPSSEFLLLARLTKQVQSLQTMCHIIMQLRGSVPMHVSLLPFTCRIR